MKRKILLISSIIALVIVLSVALSACTGGLFTFNSYKLVAEASVESVPSNANFDDAEYIKSLIGKVYLDWDDDSTTKVNLSDCEISHKVKNDKLEIKIKFGKKSCELKLDIVEPSDNPADENPPTIGTFQKAMIVEGMTDEQIKAAIDVFVIVPDQDDAVPIASDGYEIRSRKTLPYHDEFTLVLYVEEYDIESDELEFEYYLNPQLILENEEDLRYGMTESEVESVLKVYVVEGVYLDFECEITVDEEYDALLKITTKDNGHIYTSFVREYSDLLIEFDKAQYKEDITDEEIIAALTASRLNDEGELAPFELSGTITLCHVENNRVLVYMDGDYIGSPVSLVGESSENGLGDEDDDDDLSSLFS